MTFPLPGGRALLLAGSGRAGLWLLAGGVALGLILVLYRQERRVVSHRAGLCLVGLRLLAVLLLVAALFQPIATRTLHEPTRGRVLLAIDGSASMDQTDPRRPEAEALRLSRLIGLSAGESVGDLARREVAAMLADGDRSPLGKLAARNELAATSFARARLVSGPLSGVVDAVRNANGAPGENPDRLGTDGSAALGPALEGSDVVAAVVVSDGRFNTGEPVADLADRLKARGIPVFGVLVGTTDRPRDVAIAAVRAPDLVAKGDTGSITVTVKADGVAPGTEIGVTLSRPGQLPTRRVVVAPGDGSRPVVTFPVPFPEAGLVPVTIAADLATPDDARPDNNTQTVTVQVADDPTRVLLVESESRWEYRYLRDTLSRDPRLKVDRIVFHPPAVPETEPNEPNRWPDPPPSPADPDPLSRYDLIIVGDVAPVDLDAAAWKRLDQFAAVRGGTLVLLAGPRGLGSGSLSTEARALLPVLDPTTPTDPPAGGSGVLPGGWRVRPAPAALADRGAWPMLTLSDFDQTNPITGFDKTNPTAGFDKTNPITWEGLPPLPWVVAGRTKLAATGLLQPAGAGRTDAATVAAQLYGLGKVLWVGTDGTWRWRYRTGDTIHGRFWGQVVRWAGPGGLAVGNAAVRFGPERPRARAGTSVRIRARLIGDRAGSVGAPLLVARVVPRDAPPGAEGLAMVTLRSDPGQAGMFVAEVPGLPKGRYCVRLDAPDLLRFGPIPDAPLEVLEGDTGETVELAADPSPLELLATRTGGQVVADHQADRIAELVGSKIRSETRTVETPLWDTPAALILFVALLAAEWIVRKKVGLP